MKYKPSLPLKNDNISHNHPFSEFVLLCVGLAALFLISFWALGLFVDFVADHVSYETEAALFKSVSKHFDFQLENNSHEQQRIQSLVEKLQNCSQLPYDLQVHMFQSDIPNAFALPGGNIGVSTELLKVVTTENGLAFVLAHELGHFENRDHLRSMGRSLILYLLFSMITGADSSISSFLAPTSNISQAQYSQARESLADRTAFDTLHCYYGHVGGAFEFFNNLLASEQDFDIAIFHYFSSHPQLQERISDLSQYAEARGYNFAPTN
jgi:Zn-dependent protease with chaperone function